MASYVTEGGHRYKIDGAVKVLVDKPEVVLSSDVAKAPADGVAEITITLTAIGPDAGVYDGDATLVLVNTGKQYTASMSAGVLTFRLSSTVVFDPVLRVRGDVRSLDDLRLSFGDPPVAVSNEGHTLTFTKTGNLVAIDSDATDDTELTPPLTTEARDRLLQEAVKRLRVLGA